MKGLTLKRAIAAATFTPNQWGLGDSEDREIAADMLNAALVEAVNAEGANPAFVYDSMAAVQSQFDDIGANDDVASELIVNVVSEVFG